MNSPYLPDYFHYGYYPAGEYASLPSTIQSFKPEALDLFKEEELLEKGSGALRKSFKEKFDSLPTDSHHVLPLSGGLDSRTVLGLLLERTHSEQIHTVTFGVPGTWDYELGKQVAHKAGVSSEAITSNSRKFDWSLGSLLEYTRTLDYPKDVFGGFIGEKSREKVIGSLVDECVLWSGFLGDVTAGDHDGQYDPKNEDWDDVCQTFSNVEKVISCDLTPQDYEPTDILPNDAWLDPSVIPYGLQLDFGIRQQCLIRPPFRENLNIHSPFNSQPWINFALSLPYDKRKNRRFFKKMISDMYPALFSIPVESNRGLPLTAGPCRRKIDYYLTGVRLNLQRWLGISAIAPSFQFMDFSRELRRDGEFQNTLRTLISSFSERGICDQFDSIELWKTHQSGENLATELRLIASLELFIQSR